MFKVIHPWDVLLNFGAKSPSPRAWLYQWHPNTSSHGDLKICFGGVQIPSQEVFWPLWMSRGISGLQKTKKFRAWIKTPQKRSYIKNHPTFIEDCDTYKLNLKTLSWLFRYRRKKLSMASLYIAIVDIYDHHGYESNAARMPYWRQFVLIGLKKPVESKQWSEQRFCCFARKIGC